MKSKELKKQVKEFLKNVIIHRVDYSADSESVPNGEYYEHRPTRTGTVTIQFEFKKHKKRTYSIGCKFEINKKIYILTYINSGEFALCSEYGTTYNGSFYVRAGQNITEEILNDHIQDDWTCE